MSHQCVHCGRICPAGSREILDGCKQCGGHFFFYIRDDQLENLKKNPANEIPQEEKKQVEKDIRDMAGITREDVPVVLDIESVKVTGAGKFEIDLVKLFSRDRPLVYKLEEGKYVIDLASKLKESSKEKK